MNSIAVAKYFIVFGCPHECQITRDTLPTKIYSYPDTVHIYEDSAIQLLSMPFGMIIRDKAFDPITHNFLVTRGNGSKYYGSCVTIPDNTHTSAYSVSKSIVLISDFPFYSTLQSYLSDILKMLSSTKTEITFESYIYNLINNVTFPSNDCILRIHSPTDTHLYSILPSKEDLPLFQLGYTQLCRFLNPSILIKVVTCILLEHSILIQSDNLEKLHYFCESLSSLIYPFFWTYPYVPILPSPSVEFLDAPLPFIIGWLYRGETRIDSDLKFSGAYCRINLSTSCVDFSEHYIPQLPFSEQIHNELTKLYNVHLFSNSRSLETSEEQVSSLTELMSIVKELSNIRVQSPTKRRDSIIPQNTPIPDECYSSEIFTKEFISRMEFDCKVRNIFYSLFLNTFSDVAKFIIRPNSETLLTRTFDKIAFLSENTTKDREFLSQFFETQMFTKFIDDLIENITPNDVTHPIAKLFISHLSQNSETSKLVFPVGNYNTTCEKFIFRAKNSQTIEDVTAPMPIEISDTSPPLHGYNGLLPDNMHVPLACGISNDNDSSPGFFTVCNSHDNHDIETVLVRDTLDYPHLIAVELSDLLRQASLRIKQLITHHFTLTLRNHYEPDLNTSDTDRILIGHRKYSSISIEDKGLISNLIEALENIWRHGYTSQTEGSHLWEHILAYKNNSLIHYFDSVMLPALDTKKRFKAKYVMSRSFSYSLPSSPPRRLETRRGSVGTATNANPLITEVQHILDQDSIMTDIGRVRMWIKLLLEKQSLSLRVKELLTLNTYINSNYHKSSFLRTDTELEQLMYHLDSLSCVEFSCFTHDFPQSELNYSATLSIAKTMLKHTSVLWLVVSGTLGRTDVIKLPKGSHFCTFKCHNIGHILGVRVGHDNGGLNPDVFINNIKITNDLTGNLYVIEANRSLSEKQKDESVEYYFAARKYLTQQTSLNIRFEGNSDSDSTSECIKTRLQDSIRDVIHYFTEPRLAIHSLTYLVLGENRFIPLLVEMLLYELNCTKNPFTQLWAYFSHILIDMKFSLSRSVNITSSQNWFITTFSKLEDYNNRSGPIEKIYVFLMTSLSHQILHEWIELMSESTCTTLYYKDNAFLLSPEQKEYMYGAVATLRSYKIPVDLLFTLYID